LHYRSARAQIMLLGLQLNYKPSESHVIALFASLQENKWADKCMNILDSQCWIVDWIVQIQSPIVGQNKGTTLL